MPHPNHMVHTAGVHPNSTPSMSTQAQNGSQFGNHAGGNTWGQPNFRLKLPEFDGMADVEEWLLIAHYFFNFYSVLDWDRIKTVSLRLKGTAANWFDWLMQIRDGIVSWEDFCQAIRLEFSPSQFTDYTINLKLLRQEGTVQDYSLQFQKLSKRVKGVPEKSLVSQYMGGLKEEVRYEVQIAKPEILSSAMHLARMYEDKLIALKKNTKLSLYPNKGVSTNNWSSGPTSEGQRKTISSNVEYKGPPTTKHTTISPTKLLRRKNLGLCFLCDEKWSRGHKCKEKKLYVLVPDEEDDNLEEADEVSDVQQCPASEGQSLFEISLQALSGSAHHSIIKLRGTVRNKTVMILVDSGSTYSFIDTSFSERVRLPLSHNKPFDVMVANGERLSSKSLCPEVKIEC